MFRSAASIAHPPHFTTKQCVEVERLHEAPRHLDALLRCYMNAGDREWRPAPITTWFKQKVGLGGSQLRSGLEPVAESERDCDAFRE